MEMTSVMYNEGGFAVINIRNRLESVEEDAKKGDSNAIEFLKQLETVNKVIVAFAQ